MVSGKVPERFYGTKTDQDLFPLLQIKPVQKQTRAGQRTRFKAIVIIGDSEGHVGLGIKTSKEVATAIRAAIIIAKLSVIPVRRGYWGTNLGTPHSLPVKESGKCGSVTVRVSYSNLTLRKDSRMLRRAQSDMKYPIAYPCSPWYRPGCLARCQASPPACWYRGCLHIVVRLNQDPREHPEGHFLGRFQHIRFPYPQPVEGDQAHQEPAGGVCRHPQGRQALLDVWDDGLNFLTVVGASLIWLSSFAWVYGRGINFRGHSKSNLL